MLMIDTTKRTALRNTILRGVVGSTAHGLAIPGTDDLDEMGVFVEPAENVCGLSPIEHLIQRDQPDGVRSQPGDLDLTLYSLRKFCRLAAQGNPSVLVLLWLPEYTIRDPLAERLLAIRGAFVSREAGKRFLGYLQSQKASLTGLKKKEVSRPELVEKYGYDTKFAMHALRLAYQGLEYTKQGTLTLPTPESARSTLLAIRRGEVPFGAVLGLVQDAEEALRAAVAECPRRANLELINQAMVRIHREYWERTR